MKNETLSTICSRLTLEFRLRYKVKIVIAFDESQELLNMKKGSIDLSDGTKGSLFHAIYKAILPFNNVVFIGSTLNLVKVDLSISDNGRLISKIVMGSLEPWSPTHVQTILEHKFNLSLSPKNMALFCYLLSGPPQHTTDFHKALLMNSRTLHKPTNKQLKSVCMSILDDVVVEKVAHAQSKVVKFIDSGDRHVFLETIFKMLFGQPCSCSGEGTIENALITLSVAHVVRIGTNNFFEIVDPIDYKCYFKFVFTNYREELWTYIARRCETSTNEDTFEIFITLLLMEESERLSESKSKNHSSSPLFRKLKDLSFDNCCLNFNSFIRDKTLSKSDLELSNNILGMWYSQLDNIFLDSGIKPYNKMGPDLIFYLKNSENLHVTVLSAISLISDPVNNPIQPCKACRMLETTNFKNLQITKKEIYLPHTELDTQDIIKNFKLESNPCLRLLISPNMETLSISSLKQQYNSYKKKATAYDEDVNASHTVHIIGQKEIFDCIDQHKKKPYVKTMKTVFKLFLNKPTDN
ncbi:predicted protein [Naegleria gruberi]|uniref:Predicted protein n=1 Tax=Naegleria gruberi TaxID=5762 RepID=D2VJ72_NAEGR|nr:uncharacterized protein NAEGRDRAFT_49984 [Naegleria gruberi]EFC43228.1 predicted protein [Naegleria gruberi]|eukprot:XP_002675972.1 predicted protein [Naegleria gruberi strain NEG-M]